MVKRVEVGAAEVLHPEGTYLEEQTLIGVACPGPTTTSLEILEEPKPIWLAFSGPTQQEMTRGLEGKYALVTVEEFGVSISTKVNGKKSQTKKIRKIPQIKNWTPMEQSGV